MITKNSHTINDAPLMLSVSGLRGIIGQSLIPPVAVRYAAGFGQWLKSEGLGTDTPHVVIGRDSRPSGEMMAMAATAGLIGVGCQVTDIGIATTPGVAIMTEHLKADGGLVITASHNPIIWNGIKALRADGMAPPPQQAQEIIRQFNHEELKFCSVECMQPVTHDTTVHETHVDRVLAHIDTQAIRKRRFKVVVDSVHGAGGPVTAKLMNQLGVELISLYATPTGHFPHEPEPNKQNLTELCQVVQKHQADIGFAQDPDADRLAVVDEQGCYIGEEYTLVLACLQLLRRSDTIQPATLVANLSTSRMIDDLSKTYNTRVIRTPVGEANVATAIKNHNALMGGEGNGGVIWPKVGHVRNSVAGMALLLELMAHSQKPLSNIVSKIPRYAIVKDKINIPSGMASQGIELLGKHYTSQETDTQDGIRIDWPDRWVHVRPSNTEPILRIIAEADTVINAQQLINDVKQILPLS